MTIRNVYGNNQTIVRDFSQTLKLVTQAGNTLNLAASFQDEDVSFSVKRSVSRVNVPGRTSMFCSGYFELPIDFVFMAKNTSLGMADQENFLNDIEQFFRDAPGNEVDIYWMDSVDNDGLEWKAWLPSCQLEEMIPVRKSGKRLREESIVTIKVLSRSTRWYKDFPSDSNATVFPIEGSTVINTPTNDGSPSLVVRRAIDGVVVCVITDQGLLKTARGITEWADLSAYQ